MPIQIFSQSKDAMMSNWQCLIDRLDRIETTLKNLAEKQAIKEWYGTEELACMLGKAEFTVREWCRHGRLRAEKRLSGRGAFASWAISHDELLRYQREGLLPLRRNGVA
jgi:predicted site-specific integrase-resolvase